MRRIGLAAALVAALAACDQFSLFDELSLDTGSGLRIVPSSVIVDANGLYAFAAIGGTAPYDFQLMAGAGTVSAINPTTGLYQAPAAVGAATVRLTDALGEIKDAAVSVVAWQSLTLNPLSIILQAGASYPFYAIGGTPGYTYSIVTPAGGGTIVAGTGVYTASVATPPVTVILRATDAVGAFRDATVSVVSGGALGINPTSATVEQGDSLAFSGYGGAAGGYTYALNPGTNATLSAGGLFTALSSAVPGDIYTVRVTDTALATADALVTIAPAAPSNLVANGSYDGPQAIELTWDDNATGETGYEISEKAGSGAFAVIHTTTANVESYQVTSRIPNTPYTYKVRAVKDPGGIYSAFSDPDYALANF